MKNAGIKIVVGAGVVVGGYYLVKALRTKNAADKLVIKFEGVDSFKIVDGKVKFNLKYSALNPTGKDLNIESMFLDIGLRDSKNNDLQIGKVENTSLISVPGKNKVYKSIEVETNALFYLGVNVLIKLLAYVSGGSPLPNSAYIKGTVTANGFSEDYNEMIPFSTSAAAKQTTTAGLFGCGRLGEGETVAKIKKKSKIKNLKS